jgi:hypothetical protein
MGFDRMTAPLMHVMRSFAFSKVPLLSRPPISTEKKIRKVTHQRSQGSLEDFWLPRRLELSLGNGIMPFLKLLVTQ